MNHSSPLSHREANIHRRKEIQRILIYCTLQITLNGNLIISFTSSYASCVTMKAHSLSSPHKMCPITCVCRQQAFIAQVENKYHAAHFFRSIFRSFCRRAARSGFSCFMINGLINCCYSCCCCNKCSHKHTI